MLPLYDHFPPLFDLVFRSSAIPSLIGVTLDIFIIVLVLRRGGANALTRPFLLFVVCVLLWGITEFMVRLSQTVDSASFWVDMGVPGWTFMAPLFFTFVLLYVGRDELLDSYLGQIFIFGPSLLSLFMVWNTDLVITRTIEPVSWGWNAVTGPLFPVFIFWTEIYFLISLWLLLKLFLHTKDSDKRMQTLLIIVGISIAIFAGTITDALLPILGKRVMGTAIVSTAITNIFIAYAILKFRLFSLSPAAAITPIINTMHEALFVLDVEGFIELANPASCKLLDFKERELVGAHIKKLFRGESAWSTFYTNVLVPLSHGKSLEKIESVFAKRNGEALTLEISASSILSPTHEPIGIVALLRDVSKEKELIERLEKTKDELRFAKYQLERQIGEMLVR